MDPPVPGEGVGAGTSEGAGDPPPNDDPLARGAAGAGAGAGDPPPIEEPNEDPPLPEAAGDSGITVPPPNDVAPVPAPGPPGATAEPPPNPAPVGAGEGDGPAPNDDWFARDVPA